MSQAQPFSRVNPRLFMGPEEARKFYGLSTRESLFASELDRTLTEKSIARVAMPVSESDFTRVLDDYEACIDEMPALLASTYGVVDSRFGNEAGHVRREQKVTDGIQSADGKSFFHFNEEAYGVWSERLAHAPDLLTTFMDEARELHHELIAIGFTALSQLEETHPNIVSAHFPGRGKARRSFSFMRLISYDSYVASGDLGEVAKPHHDISHFTIQAHADAEGFWGAVDETSDRIPHDTEDNTAFLFAGKAYQKIYGEQARIAPLYHGVDRIAAPQGTQVPRRRAVILFIDAPLIDHGVTPQDTLPQLASN